MAKLTKAQAKQHAAAVAILAKDGPLTADEKEFVARNWNEAADHLNTIAGAHFTPFDLAMDTALDVGGDRLLDLCAGIGILGLAAVFRGKVREQDLVCIEINPAYVAVGKRLLPEATWITADAFAFPSLNLGRFDCIMSNPPFGKSATKTGSGPRYTGPDFDLALLDLAADHADWLIFIMPQGNCGFQYSGRHYYERPKTGKGPAFEAQTGLYMECGIGIDTSLFRNDWKTVSVTCEIVTVDVANCPAFTPARVDASAPAVEPLSLANGIFDQLLMPGVAPIQPLRRELDALVAKRAHKRGMAPMPAGGLFAAPAPLQQNLF